MSCQVRTSFSWRCCRNIFSTNTSGFMGGSARISLDTMSAASGPLATSKLMSKLNPLSTSVNLMMGTFALPMICTRSTHALDQPEAMPENQGGRHNW